MYQLSNVQSYAYASGAFGKSLHWYSGEFLFLYYLAEIQGLGVGRAGTILFISLIWAGILDVLIAGLVDKIRFSYQQIIAFSLPVTTVSFALLFSPIDISADWRFAYFFILIMVFRVGYTFMDIPHNAMLGTLTDDSHERTKLSTYRTFFNSSAVLLGALFTGKVLGILETNDTLPQLLLVLGFSVVYIANIVFCVTPIWRINTDSSDKGSYTFNLHNLLCLFKNRPFVTLMAFATCGEVFVSIFTKMGVYLASILLGDEKLITGLIIGFGLGKVCAMPLFIHLFKNMEKKQGLRIASIGLMLCMLLFYATSPRSLMGLSSIFFLTGICFGAIHILVWSAIPDTIEYAKYHFGVANNALTFGLFHLFMSIGNGLSFMIIAQVLSYTNYHNAPHEQVSQQLILLCSVITIFGAMLSVLVIQKYPITHALHHEMADALNKTSRQK